MGSSILAVVGDAPHCGIPISTLKLPFERPGPILGTCKPLI